MLSSTFGVSQYKWMLSAKSTVTTMIASFGGGLVGLIICYAFYGGKMKVKYIESCVFASLVAIAGMFTNWTQLLYHLISSLELQTASCYIVTTWEAFLIGAFSALLCYLSVIILEQTDIDDPCGAFSVHGVAGIWGMLAVGIFGDVKPNMDLPQHKGLLWGGPDGYYLFAVQTFASLVLVVWSMGGTYLLLKLLNRVCDMRMSMVDELLGADYTVHNILHPDIGVEEAVEVLSKFHEVAVGLDPTGNNLG